MSDSLTNIQRKINGAHDLQSVVRTMKAIAASNVGQFEQSARAVGEYFHTLELALSANLRLKARPDLISENGIKKKERSISAIVFGSDQGLVGQFNDNLVDFVMKTFTDSPEKYRIWSIGERMNESLIQTHLPIAGVFNVPNSVKAITPLIGQILLANESQQIDGDWGEFYLFYNRPTTNVLYTPIRQRLLPLDEKWLSALRNIPWPTKSIPEILNGNAKTLRVLIREYLFVSLFRACAESLASENSSRLSAMQRADKNIEQMLEGLTGEFHNMRQDSIDEELFDVISSFEALSGPKTPY